jgi:flagellar biosynthesis regulator FlaF
MKTKKKYNPIPKDIGDYIAYSEESSTGLINKVSRHYLAKKGQESGSLSSNGYYGMFFKRKRYSIHRIVYFLNTGVDPEEKQVDHIDGNRLNNKIWNLRLATHKQNSNNREKQENNASGITGVYLETRTNKHRAFLKYNGKMISFGRFCNKDKATAVRIAAETDPRFKDQEFRHSHNDKHTPSPEMLVWAKQYLEDRIERLNWKEKYNLQ